MAIYYRYEGHIRKPSNVTWWNQAFPDQARERVNALKALNLADPWIFEVIDGDNQSYQMYFKSVEDFNIFMSTSRSLSSTPIWHAYNNEHGIVETIFEGFVEVDPVDLESMT